MHLRKRINGQHVQQRAIAVAVQQALTQANVDRKIST
jgi:hypothetical protein